MKKSSAVLLLALFIGPSMTGKAQGKPMNSRTPLTTEELRPYGVFLDSFVGGSGESIPMSVSEKTIPLILNPQDKEGCLQGIGFKISGVATQATHVFPASIIDGRPISLVDPNKQNAKDLQSGLLSVSEIGFDDTHGFAVIKFSLLQSGFVVRQGTRVFSKSNGKWTRTNRPCPEWFS
jgi:hypothetical protein